MPKKVSNRVEQGVEPTDEDPVSQMDLSWLETYTGKSRIWWLRFVERTIEAAATTQVEIIDGQGLSHVRTEEWPRKVVAEVIARLRATFELRRVYDHDPQIIVAIGIGQVFSLWAFRVMSAKAMDPRRELRSRQTGLAWVRDIAREMVDLALDDRFDRDIFNQPWEHPTSKKE